MFVSLALKCPIFFNIPKWQNFLEHEYFPHPNSRLYIPAPYLNPSGSILPSDWSLSAAICHRIGCYLVLSSHLIGGEISSVGGACWRHICNLLWLPSDTVAGKRAHSHNQTVCQSNINFVTARKVYGAAAMDDRMDLNDSGLCLPVQ